MKLGLLFVPDLSGVKETGLAKTTALSRKWWHIIVLLFFAAGRVQGRDLPHAPPAEVGFSSQGLAYIDKVYAGRVERGEMAGIVMLISRHGKIAHFSAVGYADVERRKPMRKDTIFRFYSMTKPIAATALMMLYAQGRFQLGEPVSKYIPEFAHLRVLRSEDSALEDTRSLARAPTVEDLLRHTAGFTHCVASSAIDKRCAAMGYWGLDLSLTDMMAILAQLPLRDQPRTKFSYSVAPDVEARMVEVLSGQPFSDYLECHIFQPLGMTDTGYNLPSNKIRRLAAAYQVAGGKLVPLGKDSEDSENTTTWAIYNPYTARHAHTGGSLGLVGTPADYWRFAQMMLNSGELNGVRILSPQVVHLMTRDHLGPIPFYDEKLNRLVSASSARGIGFGLGFAIVKDPAVSGFMSSEGSYFWVGAMGTIFWVDPRLDMVVVAMTQGVPSEGEEAFWSQIRSLVYAALLK